MSSQSQRSRPRKNFIQANIRAVSCTPSPARSTSGSRIAPRTPTLPSQCQYLTPDYNPSRVSPRTLTRSHSSPSEVEKIKEKLEAVQNENKDMKKKLELNEIEQQRKLADVEKENSKLKKKFKDLKVQVKLLERLVTRTTAQACEVSPAPNPESVMETIATQVTKLPSGPGTCGACGRQIKRLDQHKSRTKNPECKNL